MRRLLRYVLKNYAFLLFLFLEVLSFVFIFNFNSYQKAKYFNSANHITASVYNSFSSVINYFGLAIVNRDLAEENARLKSVIVIYLLLELLRILLFQMRKRLILLIVLFLHV